MILDCKEVIMNVENSICADENYIVDFFVNYEGLEQGERYLHIPYGIKGIEKKAFEEYNSSEVIANIYRMLMMPEYYIAEWSKRITSKKVVKITFPPEVGKTIRERASFLAEKEKRVRILGLHLPASVELIQTDAFPLLLEEITVDNANRNFASKDGVLFSKDMKTLLRYPGYRLEECYTVPEGVERIAEGAFSNAVLRKLILPSTLKEIDYHCFVNTEINELTADEGLQVIRTEAFVQCNIKKIELPFSMKKIENYAFRGMTGVESFVCEGDELSVGIGIFSQGTFDNVDWWPWCEIPKATFLNSNIKQITVPDGVVRIGDYAFAGCYQAKKIKIAASVSEIGMYSFDEGDSFCADIELPQSLFKYVYRFPALSKINKVQKSQLWNHRDDLHFNEATEVLWGQKNTMEKYIASLNFFQKMKKDVYEKEIQVIESLLKEM